MNFKNKKLYRSERDKIVAGVAGGLGEYFDIEPLLIRFLFVLLASTSGIGIIIYIFMWLLIPTESKIDNTTEQSIEEAAEEMKQKAENFGKEFESMAMRHNVHILTGAFIIFLGIWLLGFNFGIIGFFDLAKLLGPLVFIIIGIFIILKTK